MRAKKSRTWLKTVLLSLAVVIMALVCHVAYSPYNILPSGLKYAVYPVSASAPVAPLAAGDLAVCLKGAELGAGWLVRYVPHGTSRFASTGVRFGHMLEYAGVQGTVYDMYKVQVELGGQVSTLDSARPELVIYRVERLGGVVLWLNEYRHAVLCVCAGVILAYMLLLLVTAKPRRLRRSREMYLKMFEGFAQQFENEAEDF